MSEALPFGSSGGTAIQHYFPVDGEYRLAVRLSRNNYNYIHGLSEPRDLEVRLNRKLLKVFTVGRRDLPASAEGWAGTLDGPAEWEQYGRAADTDFNVRFAAQAGLQNVGAGVECGLDLPEPFAVPVFVAVVFDLLWNLWVWPPSPDSRGRYDGV